MKVHVPIDIQFDEEKIREIAEKIKFIKVPQEIGVQKGVQKKVHSYYYGINQNAKRNT